MTCCPEAAKREQTKGFRPDYNGKPITEKFYARHETLNIKLKAQLPNVDVYLNELQKRMTYDPREHFYAPLTENQVYGWTEGMAFRYPDKIDNEIFCHPNNVDETMATLRKIAYDMKQERLLNMHRK